MTDVALMKPVEVRTLLISNKNKMFSVDFIKKDGTLRKMSCIYKGEGEIPKEPKLLVWDIQNKGWRSIPLDRVYGVRMLGKEY